MPTPSSPPVRPARNWTAPYVHLFTPPGAPAFTAGSLVARLPMGMFTVAAVTMIAGQRGSYALAGAVLAVLMTLPLVAAASGGLPVLAGALLVAGMATAPTMATGMTLIQRLVPPARLNEGMTLAVTALLAGVAAGSAGGGWSAQHLPGGPATAYALPAGAAVLAATVALAALRRRT